MNEDRTCPYCEGTAHVLGNLGRIVYYRCENCGIQFRVLPKSFKPKAEVKRQAKERRLAIRIKRANQEGE